MLFMRVSAEMLGGVDEVGGGLREASELVKSKSGSAEESLLLLRR